MQAVNLEERQSMHEELMEDDDIELMTANLLRIKREITERNEQTINLQEEIENEQQWVENQGRVRRMIEDIRLQYDQFLTARELPSNHEHKLEMLLQENYLSVGCSIALFEMLYYFRQAIDFEILREISEKAYRTLRKSAKNQLQKQCLLELIALCGVYSEDITNYVIEEMLEGRLEFTVSFVVLSNMGFGGFSALVHLARQDFKNIPILILDNLSRTEEIIKELLIPTLVEDLSSAKNKGKEKEIILAILNRLNHLVSLNPTASAQLMSILIELMQNASTDRGFVASVLRSSGLEGEQILLQFMSEVSYNEKIMLPIVNILPWRVQSDPVLRIKVIEYTLGSNFMPGTLYQYEGNIEPSAFCFQQDQCCDSLCLNARDFIAALQRLLSDKELNYQNQQLYRKSAPNNIKLFKLYEVINQNKQELEEIQISVDVVKALAKALSNSKPEIREAALNSLGLIGLPETYDVIDQIVKCLWDKDSRNRSMACWALSKICEDPSKKVVGRLVELLRDNFWKVRISACICIGAIVREPLEYVVEGLVRCLKDNSVNKVTVSQSIIKLGPIGEEILLQILKNATGNDFKLKEAVIYSLKDANVKSPTIDYVLEQIFKHCKGTRIQTRATCLETLNSLRVRALEEGEQIVYLKAKSILPFYYYFLEDPSLKIREMAADAIFSFGVQAELIFIEGMTKGNPLVRIQSAKGLAKLGVQNFRALILGLRDEDSNVRKITADVITKNFTSSDIVNYYQKKPQQVASLLCNLKDILSGTLSRPIKTVIKQTIYNLERINKNQDSHSRSYNENQFNAYALNQRR